MTGVGLDAIRRPNRSPAAAVARDGTVRMALALGLVAAVVSATGSWIPSLWGDEAASLLSAERSLPSLGMMLQHVDAVHGTYYLGLHAWIAIAGTTPFAIRLPSAMAVGAATTAVVLIGRRFGSLRWGVVAGILCAVIPRMTYDGEEARSYAFSAAIAAWATFALLLSQETARPRRARIAYTALLALGMYVFLYVALLVLAHACVLLARRAERAEWRSWAVSVGVAFAAASPVIVAAVFQRDQIAYLADREEISVDSTLVAMWFGQPVFAVLGWVLLALGVVAAALSWRSATTDRGAITRVAAVAWAVVPSLVLIGTSPVLSGFTARYLAFCAPAVALSMTAGVAFVVRRRRILLAATTAALVLAAAPAWAAQRGPYAKNRSDWAEIAHRIRASSRPGDAVVFDEQVRPSRRTRLAFRTYPEGFAGLTDPTLRTSYWRNTTWHDAAYTVSQAARLGRFSAVDRVWAVEYADETGVDRASVDELIAIGFTPEVTYRTYSSRIVELIRTP